MKNLLKISTLVFAIALTSCQINFGQNKISGNRNVIEKTRKVSEKFNKVRASNGLDVFISEGKLHKIIVEADENLHETIKTEVKDGVLKIYSEENIWRAKARKIYVTTPELNSVVATSGSDVVTEDEFTTQSFVAKASSGADLLVRINAQNVSGKSSSGSDLKIIGKTKNADLSSSSGSDLDADELIAQNVIAKASSGSDIELYATKNLTARASSGGDIDYKGNPKVDKKESSGGDISKK